MTDKKLAYDLGMRVMAVPSTGEILYAESVEAMHATFDSLGVDWSVYDVSELNNPNKVCECCDQEVYNLASDFINSADDVCEDCYKNQQQKSE